MECFAVCTPGLEPFTALELEKLGLAPQATQEPELTPGNSQQHEHGGVAFACSLADLARVNRGLRTATRVLVRLARFNAAKFVELRRKASRLPWENYLHPGQTIEIHASSHQSRLYHTGAVANEVMNAISERLGAAPVNGVDTTQRVMVRLVNNECTISLDSSGEPLYRRGYRLASAKAPLRESLAAGLLYAAGWDIKSPLVDPFCGSGTIPIEAALMATGRNPREQIDFAFQSWSIVRAISEPSPDHSTRHRPTETIPIILGSDRDAGAIQMATANATRAGVEAITTFTQQAFSNAMPPAGPGWLVTNPPYGQRVSHEKDLRNLYAQLGHVLHHSLCGWQFAVLCNDRALMGHTGLTILRELPFINGGIPVRLYCGLVD
ncbi:MAG: class I SAM-dependent RNA methyltransferase [Anaerolineae bacterium]|nr:class I SAM-dependent RNA methyltransferase [Anaerolineae bacterium]